MPDKSLRNKVIAHFDTTDNGGTIAYTEFSPEYDGEPVTIDIDNEYRGGAFDVPGAARDHIYFIGNVNFHGAYVPPDSTTIASGNCAGGSG